MRLLVTLVLLFASSAVFAQSWENWVHYETLISQNGTKINIDYVVRESAHNKWAAPVYINIWHPEFREDTKVQVVFINKWCHSGAGEPCPSYMQDVSHLYPRFVDGKFSVSLHDSLYLEATDPRGGHRNYSTQELAIQVNGRWLNDSISGRHNFAFDL